MVRARISHAQRARLWSHSPSATMAATRSGLSPSATTEPRAPGPRRPSDAPLSEAGRLATHHGPAGCLEIFGDVLLAPVVASPLGRHSLLAPASPAGSTIEEHVRGRAVEARLEICVSRQVHARDDEKQPGHAGPRRTHEH